MTEVQNMHFLRRQSLSQVVDTKQISVSELPGLGSSNTEFLLKELITSSIPSLCTVRGLLRCIIKSTVRTVTTTKRLWTSLKVGGEGLSPSFFMSQGLSEFSCFINKVES